MKKVLMTASVYTHIRNFHLPYLREFQRLGWETFVGCRGIPDDAPYIDRAIELPFKKNMFSMSNLLAAWEIRKSVKAEKYDLIITHTSLAAFFTRLAIMGMRDRPKLINVVHGYLFDENTPWLKQMLLLGAERLTAPETDMLLVMNEWDYQAAKKYRLGRQIEKIPGMGVDFSKLDSATKEDGIRLRRELGIPNDAFVLIYPAEFSKRKSQHVLIEAMRYLPEDIWLVLCGEGNLLPYCKALAKKLGVQERVLFPGQVKDIAVWYRMADALAASSRSEGLPFNIMEAMYCGLPVVASAVKGHIDLIEDGVTGVLFPYGDAEKCSQCMENLMTKPMLSCQISACAKKNMTYYSLRKILPRIQAAYTHTQQII